MYISRARIPTQVCLTLTRACNHQLLPIPSPLLGKKTMGEGQVTHPGLGPTAGCLRMGWRSHSGRRWPPSGLTHATEVAQRLLLKGQSTSTPPGALSCLACPSLLPSQVSRGWRPFPAQLSGHNSEEWSELLSWSRSVLVRTRRFWVDVLRLRAGSWWRGVPVAALGPSPRQPGPPQCIDFPPPRPCFCTLVEPCFRRTVEGNFPVLASWPIIEQFQ